MDIKDRNSESGFTRSDRKLLWAVYIWTLASALSGIFLLFK